MITVAKTWTFDAAHQLPNHDGKCRELHGHTYTVGVEVQRHDLINGRGGQPLQPIGQGHPDEGMVVDFAVLSHIWKERLEPRLDHRFLNESLADEVPVTTSEHLAQWLLGVWQRALPAYLHVTQVWVSETASSRATARP